MIRLVETRQEGAQEQLSELFRPRLRGADLARRAAGLAAIHSSIVEFGDEALRGLRAAEGSAPEGTSLAVELPSDPDPLTPTEAAALDRLIADDTRFYEGQAGRSWFVSGAEGELFGQQVRPYRRLGVVLPDAPFSPGILALLLVPARLLAIPYTYVSFARPPEGRARTVAAHLIARLSVTSTFQLPEEAAVIAFAVGTPTVPRVDRVLGLGGEAAHAAALLVGADVPVKLGPEAGEMVVVADGSANGQVVALDLAGRLELCPQDLVAVVTPSLVVANVVMEELGRLRADRPGRTGTRAAALGRATAIVLTRSLDEAIEIVNRYRPASVCLHVEDPLEVVSSIEGPDVVRLGEYDPPAAGHAFPLALPGPAGEAGRTLSPVELGDYLKRGPIVYRTRRSLKTLAPLVEALVPSTPAGPALRSLRARLDGGA